MTLTFGMAVSLSMSYALGSLAPFLVADLGLSRTALGSLTTVLYLFGAGLSPAAGRLVARVDGRLLLVALFGLGAGSAALAAAAASYLLLLATAALAGLAVALGNPLTNSLIATHIEPRRQGLVVGFKQSGVQVGAFLTGAVLPAVAEAIGWRGALLATAALGAAGIALALTTVPRSPASSPALGAAAAIGLLPPAVRWLSFYALLMGLGVGAIGAYLPLYAVEALGLTPTAAGFAAGLSGLVGVVARILWGGQADRSSTPVPAVLTRLAAGAIVACALLWLASIVGSWALYAGAFAIGGTGVAWNAVGMLAVVRDVEAGVSARASGRVLLGFYGGFVAGPLAFGWTVDRSGTYTPGWALVALTFVAATVLAARWSRGRMGV